MSHVSIGTQDAASWKLSAAVLVYESTELFAGSNAAAYATVHSIESRGRGLALGAGVPATKEACADLARALGAASTLSGFVPENLLYLGARAIAWWRRPAHATLYFDTTKSAAGDQQEDKTHAQTIGKRSGRTPQPGLVFAVTPGHWYVYALKGHERPGARTGLCRAPYFNVWASGEICTGNVRLPQSLSTSALERYERAFFDSEFTHPNVGARERLVRHEAGSYTFWKELLERQQLDWSPGIDEFPEGALVDAKLTLEGLVKRLEKGRRGNGE